MEVVLVSWNYAKHEQGKVRILIQNENFFFLVVMQPKLLHFPIPVPNYYP